MIEAITKNQTNDWVIYYENKKQMLSEFLSECNLNEHDNVLEHLPQEAVLLQVK